MKRALLAVMMGLAICQASYGTDPLYINYGKITNAPTVDALAFCNMGEFDTTVGITTGVSVGGSVSFYDSIYQTQNTRYYTNTGIMTGSTGFRFDTLSANKKGMYSRTSAEVFTNSGSITAVDGYDSSTLDYYTYDYYNSISSYLLVSATNIANTGTMTVGDGGIMELSGKNVNLSTGTLVAGSPDNDTESYYSGLYYYWGRGYTVSNSYVNANGVNDLYADLYWGYADLENFWGNNYTVYNSNPQYKKWVYAYQYNGSYYFNFVYIRTNDIDANLNFDARFLFGGTGDTNLDTSASEAMVRISAIGTNVVDGTLFTNSAFILDQGQQMLTITLDSNLLVEDAMRPSNLEITTGVPYEWYEGSPSNYPYSDYLIYPGIFSGDPYTNEVVYTTNTLYYAQIGRNTENVSGYYGYYYDYGYLILYDSSLYYDLNFSDPTNEVGRIEINSENLNLDGTRIRAEGMVTLNATNLVAGNKSYIDAGSLMCNLGSPTTSLVVSNVLPYTHTRLCGNVYIYTSDWTNSTAGGVNAKCHLLIVDHVMQGSQTPTVVDLKLRGTNIYTEDPIRVSRTGMIDTPNLVVNNNLEFGDKAATVSSSTIPNLKNLLVETNGYILSDQVGWWGGDTSTGLSTITNRGVFGGGSLHAKAEVIENSGTLEATLASLLSIEGTTVNLTTNVNPLLEYDQDTQTYTNIPVSDYLISYGDVAITAENLYANYSVISNGLKNAGNLTLNVSRNLSDNIPSTPGTNDVIKNLWQVKNGFTLSQKPATGDLFGTKIVSVVEGTSTPTHIWAGEDRGRSVSGFSNNVVIGRLVLDCQTSTAGMRFGGTSKKNGMYVDYLEFKDYSTNYKNSLTIDSSLVIYFADSNIDPVKLTNLYGGRLAWVPEFSGPNSSTNVLGHLNGAMTGSLTNLMVNKSLVTSIDIDSNGNGIPNAYDTYPFDGTVLSIQLVGSGNVAPNYDARPLEIGESYTVKAVPSAGYEFSGWEWACDSGNPKMSTNSAKTTFVMQSNLVLRAKFTLVGGALNLVVNGQGTVTPDFGTNTLIFGKEYTITATPSWGNLFKGWTGSVTSSSATVSFVMEPDFSLVANFETNVFYAYKGSFNGLFYGTTNGASAWNSGAFTLTLSDKGAGSGKLKTPTGTYSYTTKFDADGNATATVKRSGYASLTVKFQLTTVDDIQEVVGTIGDGATWGAELLGEKAVYSTKKPNPLKGTYTMIIAGSSENGPVGDSYGKATISASGAVSLTGKLADKTSFTQSATLGMSGRWPFFYTRTGKDVLIGWVTVNTNESSVISGTVTWAKKVATSGLYKTGFTNTFDVIGSTFTAPKSGTGLDLETPVVSVSGGDLATSATYDVALNAKTYTYSSAGGEVSLKITRSTGYFTGKLTDPVTKKSSTIYGVVLQNQNTARGCFFGSTASGQVMISQ